MIITNMMMNPLKVIFVLFLLSLNVGVLNVNSSNSFKRLTLDKIFNKAKARHKTNKQKAERKISTQMQMKSETSTKCVDPMSLTVGVLLILSTIAKKIMYFVIQHYNNKSLNILESTKIHGEEAYTRVSEMREVTCTQMKIQHISSQMMNIKFRIKNVHLTVTKEIMEKIVGSEEVERFIQEVDEEEQKENSSLSLNSKIDVFLSLMQEHPWFTRITPDDEWIKQYKNKFDTNFKGILYKEILKRTECYTQTNIVSSLLLNHMKLLTDHICDDMGIESSVYEIKENVNRKIEQFNEKKKKEKEDWLFSFFLGIIVGVVAIYLPAAAFQSEMISFIPNGEESILSNFEWENLKDAEFVLNVAASFNIFDISANYLYGKLFENNIIELRRISTYKRFIENEKIKDVHKRCQDSKIYNVANTVGFFLYNLFIFSGFNSKYSWLTLATSSIAGLFKVNFIGNIVILLSMWIANRAKLECFRNLFKNEEDDKMRTLYKHEYKKQKKLMYMITKELLLAVLRIFGLIMIGVINDFIRFFEKIHLIIKTYKMFKVVERESQHYNQIIKQQALFAIDFFEFNLCSSTVISLKNLVLLTSFFRENQKDNETNIQKILRAIEGNEYSVNRENEHMQEDESLNHSVDYNFTGISEFEDQFEIKSLHNKSFIPKQENEFNYQFDYERQIWKFIFKDENKDILKKVKESIIDICKDNVQFCIKHLGKSFFDKFNFSDTEFTDLQNQALTGPFTNLARANNLKELNILINLGYEPVFSDLINQTFILGCRMCNRHVFIRHTEIIKSIDEFNIMREGKAFGNFNQAPTRLCEERYGEKQICYTYGFKKIYIDGYYLAYELIFSNDYLKKIKFPYDDKPRLAAYKVENVEINKKKYPVFSTWWLLDNKWLDITKLDTEASKELQKLKPIDFFIQNSNIFFGKVLDSMHKEVSLTWRFENNQKIRPLLQNQVKAVLINIQLMMNQWAKNFNNYITVHYENPEQTVITINIPQKNFIKKELSQVEIEDAADLNMCITYQRMIYNHCHFTNIDYNSIVLDKREKKFPDLWERPEIKINSVNQELVPSGLRYSLDFTNAYQITIRIPKVIPSNKFIQITLHVYQHIKSIELVILDYSENNIIFADKRFVVKRDFIDDTIVLLGGVDNDLYNVPFKNKKCSKDYAGFLVLPQISTEHNFIVNGKSQRMHDFVLIKPTPESGYAPVYETLKYGISQKFTPRNFYLDNIITYYSLENITKIKRHFYQNHKKMHIFEKLSKVKVLNKSLFKNIKDFIDPYFAEDKNIDFPRTDYTLFIPYKFNTDLKYEENNELEKYRKLSIYSNSNSVEIIQSYTPFGPGIREIFWIQICEKHCSIDFYSDMETYGYIRLPNITNFKIKNKNKSADNNNYVEIIVWVAYDIRRKEDPSLLISMCADMFNFPKKEIFNIYTFNRSITIKNKRDSGSVDFSSLEQINNKETSVIEISDPFNTFLSNVANIPAEDKIVYDAIIIDVFVSKEEHYIKAYLKLNVIETNLLDENEYILPLKYQGDNEFIKLSAFIEKLKLFSL